MSTLHEAHRRTRQLYERAGIHTRADRLRFASEVVGREIRWGVELTVAEALRVAAALEAGITEPKEQAP